jgi:hypothetical protein
MTDSPPDLSLDEQLVERAWSALSERRGIRHVEQISAPVSTNHVYRVALDDGHEVIGKTSSYGSYVHFRQDHQLIQQWRRLLGGTRFSRFLASVLESEPGEVFTYRQGPRWATFYEKAPFYDFLPRVLDQEQIRALAREMAEFHDASSHCAGRLNPTWKTLGSDIGALYDSLGSETWRAERGIPSPLEEALRGHCDRFLLNAERLGYHQLQKLPVLVDWNIGNFSVGLEEHGFRLFSRWDYDWFRIEPRALDFYFCARVVRAEGDKTLFTYSADPFLDPRFALFLRCYHEVSPLSAEEVLFLKEAYRFFLLNYVVRSGEHFFRPAYCARLQRETVELHLARLDAVSFEPLLDALR